ncbi:TetR/AcrR family transcriptional regulator [Kribbella sp. NPDC051586]|uniref:TetR/AcrR family transcriptional regulator n=1 Tax=Kribbella sp. NPDC051586 TaxID=3364118 RepID=UPI0037B01AE2
MATSRGPYAKGVAKREEILRAALEVIARHGYRKTSTRELAAAVGLSEAGLLHYFGSKEKLFEAVLRARDEADQERSAGRDDLIDRLISVVRHNSDVPGLVQLYSTFSAEAGDSEHSAHEFFVERYDRLRDALAEAVRARQSDGTIDAAADPEKIATVLIALSDGLQIQSQFRLGTEAAELMDHVVGLLRP